MLSGKSSWPAGSPPSSHALPLIALCLLNASPWGSPAGLKKVKAILSETACWAAGEEDSRDDDDDDDDDDRGRGGAMGRMRSHVLPQVRTSVDRGTYVACTFDYEKDLPDGTKGRKAWTDIFRKAIGSFEKRARAQLVDDAATEEEEAMAETRAASFAASYASILDKLEADPSQCIPGFEADFSRADGPGLSCKVLCAIRETCLLRIGLRDAFKHVKAKENRESLVVLPRIIEELESCASARDRMDLALRGCFAGNLFDLGAHFSSAKYDEGDSDDRDPWEAFWRTRAALPQRPWWPEASGLDLLDQAIARLSTAGTFGKAIVFADNAGADLVCGILPFVRELLKAGTRVVIAANEKPAINDITAEELLALFTGVRSHPRVTDPFLLAKVETGDLSVVSSGSDLPIIDLSQVSARVAEEAANADLIVLQGMGRAIESNLNCDFDRCKAVLKMGVVKHPEVALCLGGNLGLPICKFQVRDM